MMVEAESMLVGPNEADVVNSFAVVTYIPDPLASFLHAVQKEIAPSYQSVRAHVTVLPPRPLPLEIGAEFAGEQLREQTLRVPAFVIEATGVEVFRDTSVIYLAVGAGRVELERMHGLLNSDGLAHAEPYPFHPHITVAQGLAPERLRGAVELTRRRWEEYSLERSFPVETFTFVQNTIQNEWIDLAEFTLAPGGSATR